VALEGALDLNDPRLLQGDTVSPLPLHPHACRPVQGAWPIAFAGWKCEGLLIVADLEEFFARVIFRARERLGDPTGGRYFLNWWDDSPRDEARRAPLAEVRRGLAVRRPKASAAGARDATPKALICAGTGTFATAAMGRDASLGRGGRR
jgi:hypothetical protein